MYPQQCMFFVAMAMSQAKLQQHTIGHVRAFIPRWLVEGDYVLIEITDAARFFSSLPRDSSVVWTEVAKGGHGSSLVTHRGAQPREGLERVQILHQDEGAEEHQGPKWITAQIFRTDSDQETCDVDVLIKSWVLTGEVDAFNVGNGWGGQEYYESKLQLVKHRLESVSYGQLVYLAPKKALLEMQRAKNFDPKTRWE